jgi:catechol 2,3-dioxygenase-like lactoylglutathione lyase family enzyme
VHRSALRGNLYGMTDEAIPVLHVSDAARAVDWYKRLGYKEEWTHRFEPSMPAFVSLARDGAARLFLSEHRGDASPDTLVYLRMSDVDAVAKEFSAEIVDQPWAREVHLTDVDGNRLRVGTPR